MKEVLTSIVYLFVLFALSGCYTILPTSEESYEVSDLIVFYPVPVPTPIPDPGPWPGPNSPYSLPTPNPDPQPKIRKPEVPIERKGSENEVRDPLRGHGNRGNQGIKTEERK